MIIQKYLLFLFLIFISKIVFAQLDEVHLKIISRVGPINITINGHTKLVKFVYNIELKKGITKIAFKNNDINSFYEYDFQKNDTLIINKYNSANVYFEMPLQSNFEFSQQEHLYYTKIDSEMDTLKFLTVQEDDSFLKTARKLKLVSAGRKTISIFLNNYKPYQINLKLEPYKNYHVNPILIEETQFVNNVVKSIENKRKITKKIISYSLIASNLYFLYKINDSVQKSNKAYKNYNNAISPSIINNYYQQHQAHNRNTKDYITYAIINASILVFVAFIENWSDLDKYYVNDSNKLNISFNRLKKSNMVIKLSYNF